MYSYFHVFKNSETLEMYLQKFLKSSNSNQIKSTFIFLIPSWKFKILFIVRVSFQQKFTIWDLQKLNLP